MLQFILGLFLGANVSLFLYACILAGAKSDKGDNNLCQKKDTTGWNCMIPFSITRQVNIYESYLMEINFY